jgi:hypothetical protein
MTIREEIAKAMWDAVARDFPDNGPFEDQPEMIRDIWLKKANAAVGVFIANGDKRYRFV